MTWWQALIGVLVAAAGAIGWGAVQRSRGRRDEGNRQKAAAFDARASLEARDKVIDLEAGADVKRIRSETAAKLESEPTETGARLDLERILADRERERAEMEDET